MEPLFNFTSTPIFQNTSFWDLIFLELLYFVAYTIKGFFGIGALPLILLLSVWVLEPHHAVLLGMLILMYNHVMFLPEAFRHGDWRLCGLLSIGYIPTVVLGVWIFGRLEHSWLGLILGILLICVILADVIIPEQRIRSISGRFPRLGAITMAAIGGALNGIVGAGNLIFLSLYLKTVYKEARTFRATLFLISILMGVWRLFVQCTQGMITASLFWESLILAPAAFLGSYLGIRLFTSMPSDNYFKAFRIILIFLALSIVMRYLISAL